MNIKMREKCNFEKMKKTKHFDMKLAIPISLYFNSQQYVLLKTGERYIYIYIYMVFRI